MKNQVDAQGLVESTKKVKRARKAWAKANRQMKRFRRRTDYHPNSVMVWHRLFLGVCRERALWRAFKEESERHSNLLAGE